jgi:hypothetical protein
MSDRLHVVLSATQTPSTWWTVMSFPSLWSAAAVAQVTHQSLVASAPVFPGAVEFCWLGQRLSL